MRLKDKIKHLKKRIQENEDKIEDLMDKVNELHVEIFGGIIIEFEPEPYLLDPNKELRDSIKEEWNKGIEVVTNIDARGTKTERLSTEELNLANKPQEELYKNEEWGPKEQPREGLGLSAREAGELAGGGDEPKSTG